MDLMPIDPSLADVRGDESVKSLQINAVDLTQLLNIRKEDWAFQLFKQNES